MNQDIFADGIGNINVTGNIVRMDLVSLQPQLKGEKGEPVFANTQRIVMPLDGFVQAVALQENIVQQLIKNGVLNVNERQNGAAEAAAAEEKAD
jgi:hypothetical protein